MLILGIAQEPDEALDRVAMPVREMKFKGKRVFVDVDDAGEPP